MKFTSRRDDMNKLRMDNIEQLTNLYSALSQYESLETSQFIQVDSIKPYSFTKVDIANATGAGESVIQRIMDKMTEEGEYIAKDGRNWSMLNRDQALTIMQRIGIKSVQDRRLMNPSKHEVPVMLINKNKGGVAKSTTALHLAVSSALDVKNNRRTLLIDGDIQGSLRHYLSLSQAESAFNSVSELIKENIHLSHEERLTESNQSKFRQYLMEKVVLTSIVDNLWFIPSVLTDIEMTIAIAKELTSGTEKSVERALTAFSDIVVNPLKSEFDFIIIDSGPAPDPLAYNLLYASNHLMIPTTGREQDFRAYLQHVKFTKMLMEQVLPSDFSGLYSIRALITKHQKQENLEATANKILASGNSAYATRILESKKYEEAARVKVPLQILNTPRTSAMRDCLDLLASLYSEVNSIISNFEFNA
ncbi:AAA family ATPase [Vibrio cholerae]|nr:AAA family ATPase [Vibrio cholerae]